jgi:GT2 family glycosyltransferase
MISIIIVHYRVEKELIACVSSIYRSKPKIKFEIIVVDNDRGSKVSVVLKEKFSQVKYIKSSNNIGFGAGNNLGAKVATGEYLFFLNPDTLVEKDSIDNLCKFMKDNIKSGMVAPLLYDFSGEIYPKQGSDSYNFLNAVVTSSFMNKLFPNNPISRRFFHDNWNKKETEEFDVVPGTAFMIKKDLFEKVGKFDEKLFLYFEEYDLAKRIRKAGYKNYIIPKAKIMHEWEVSTKKEENIDKIFSRSRFYFLKKHYGMLFASIINIISKFGKSELILGLILFISIFLNMFRLKDLMTFIGDQGWFYLSARDVLVSGQISLVGVASSHPWLHQGPLWTYILAILFWLFNFNPLAPGYFTAIMGTITVYLVYRIGSEMFSRRIGLIAGLLYATSPLIILSNRMPYHTSLIPLFTLLFIYSVYKWIKGNTHHFSLAIFFLAILYNFEIATVLLWPTLIILLTYGIIKKTNWFKKLINIKILSLSLFGFTIPMIPMLIYDVGHGFPQTLKFGLWICYRVARIFGFPNIHGDQQFPDSTPFIPFTLSQLQQLVFLPNLFFTVILLLGSFLVMSYLIYIQYKNKKNDVANIVVYLALIVSVFGYIVFRTASGAYFPLFFPFIIFMLAVGLEHILKMKKIYMLGLIVIIFIAFLNYYFLLQKNYFSGKNYGSTFAEKILVAKMIVEIAGKNEYSLIGKGSGSQFASFTMNYEYLTWWLGNGPSLKQQELRFGIKDDIGGIKLEKIKL